MRIMKRTVAAILSALMLLSIAACGGNDAPANAEGGAQKPAAKTEVNIWGQGSDNVRGMFEKLIEEFNADPAYKDVYEAKLNWVLSGTGGAMMRDMVVQAYLADQKDTKYDLIELSNGDLSFCLDRVGLEMFEKLDMSQIPNAASVEAKPIMGDGYIQPYRGTTVVLAYNSDAVETPPATMDELI